jgi:type I restriction enzyme, S subunit
MPKLLSELVHVNPKVERPAGAHASMSVSFIHMSDVTESGGWIGRQVRRLADVSSGFTAFVDGDVLVAKITPCFENGKGAHVTGLKNGIGFGSTEFHVLRARERVSPRYVHHVVQSARMRSAAEAYMSGSAGQKRVPREFFEAFSVPDSSLPEQQQTAEVLDTFDTTIRQTAAIIEKLKQVKQGLLHDLLSRGIAANGELRPPQSQAPHLYKESPLGWIPTEWAPHALGQVLIGGTRNGLYKPSSFHGSGPLMVQMGGMFRGEAVDFQSATRVRVTRPELSAFGLEVGDLLFARRSLTFEGAGRCAIVRNLPEASTFESSIVRARVDRSRVEPEFAALFLRGALSSAHRRTLIRQVAVSGVSSDDIAHFLIALPRPVEQAAIIDAIASVQRRIEHETVESHKLSLQKSGLMDDLLTGRVRVTPLLRHV